MSINSIEFGSSDKLALEYIIKRGYCSYSSMTNVRDKRDPGVFVPGIHYDIGAEVHSRFLERKKIKTFALEHETMIKAMVHNLATDPIVMGIMKEVFTEKDFNVKLRGLRVFGRLDIWKPKIYVADLKTTSQTSKNSLINSLDFLQAAMYMRATGVREFYYIGACKLPPYNVWTFNVNNYPVRMREANKELDSLIDYIKKAIEK